MAKVLTIRRGIVHVWPIPLSDPALVASLGTLLSGAERGRADRLPCEAQRRAFVIAHGRTREVLAGYLGARPERLDFATGEHGKPRVRSGEKEPEIEFNLSHSGEIALVAVAQSQAVGIDIQKWNENLEYLAISQRFFSSSEHDNIAAANGNASLPHKFYSCWTRKEAYIKATGYGISRGLGHFDVAVAPAPAVLREDRLDPDAPNRWRLEDLGVPSGYSAALAVEGPLDLVVVQDPDVTNVV